MGLVPYYKKWSECGSQPVIMSEYLSVGFSAGRPSYVIVTAPSLLERSYPSKLFCSVDQAESSVGGFGDFRIE